jgi:hypothetical protein
MVKVPGNLEAYMAIPEPVEGVLKPQNKKSPVKSPICIDAFVTIHKGPSCGVLEPHAGLSELHDDERDAFFSAERTRLALLSLMDDPKDKLAIEAVWQENAEVIQRVMVYFVDSPSNPANIDRILEAVAADSKYFCDEFDDPKEWVARCASLESRRFALESKSRN